MARIAKQIDYLKTALRLPRDLHTKIHEAADSSGRTMNAEIVSRLERTFFEDFARLDDSPSEAKDIDDLFVEITQKIEAVKFAMDRYEKMKGKSKD